MKAYNLYCVVFAFSVASCKCDKLSDMRCNDKLGTEALISSYIGIVTWIEEENGFLDTMIYDSTILEIDTSFNQELVIRVGGQILTSIPDSKCGYEKFKINCHSLDENSIGYVESDLYFFCQNDSIQVTNKKGLTSNSDDSFYFKYSFSGVKI